LDYLRRFSFLKGSKMSQAGEPKGVLNFLKLVKNLLFEHCKRGSGGSHYEPDNFYSWAFYDGVGES